MFERTSIGTLLKCLMYITDNCTEPPSSERYAALERSMNAQIEVEREHHQKMLIENGNLQRQLQELQVLFITSSVFCVCTLVNRSVPHFIPHFVPHIVPHLNVRHSYRMSSMHPSHISVLLCCKI